MKKTTTKKETVKKPKTTKEKPIITGEITYTFENLKEVTTSSRAFQKNFYFILLIVMFIEAIGLIIVNKDYEISLPIVSIFLCIFTIFLDFTKKPYNRQVRLNDNKEVHEKIEFYDNKIKLINVDNKQTVDFEYKSINKVYETKNILVLILKYNTGVTVDKRTLKEESKLKELILSKTDPNINKIKRVRVMSKYFFIVALIVNILLLIFDLIMR